MYQDEVVNLSAEFDIGLPATQLFGQLLAAGAERLDGLVHLVDVGHHLSPRNALVLIDGVDDILRKGSYY